MKIIDINDLMLYICLYQNLKIMGKGNVYLKNLNGEQAATYYVDIYTTWEDAETIVKEQKRDELLEHIQSKKHFCCKRTVAEMGLPIKATEAEIMHLQQMHNCDAEDNFYSDVREILNDPYETEEYDANLISANLGTATIIAKNENIMAVIADNESKVAIAFVPSEAVHIVDTNAITEIDELCNKAYKRLHEMYPKSVSKRTGPWTSKEIDIQENYL